MPHHSEDSRSAAQRRADYERYQELRRQAQAHMAAAFEIWRDCDSKTCRRSKSCAGPCVATCLSDWADRHIDDATRAVLHAGVKARVAGAGVEEACAVAERLAERIEAERAALASGKSWHEVALAAPSDAEPAPAAADPAAPPEPEGEAARAARIRALREAERRPKGLAHWAR